MLAVTPRPARTAISSGEAISTCSSRCRPWHDGGRAELLGGAPEAGHHLGRRPGRRSRGSRPGGRRACTRRRARRPARRRGRGGRRCRRRRTARAGPTVREPMEPSMQRSPAAPTQPSSTRPARRPARPSSGPPRAAASARGERGGDGEVLGRADVRRSELVDHRRCRARRRPAAPAGSRPRGRTRGCRRNRPSRARWWASRVTKPAGVVPLGVHDVRAGVQERGGEHRGVHVDAGRGTRPSAGGPVDLVAGEWPLLGPAGLVPAEAEQDRRRGGARVRRDHVERLAQRRWHRRGRTPAAAKPVWARCACASTKAGVTSRPSSSTTRSAPSAKCTAASSSPVQTTAPSSTQRAEACGSAGVWT